MSNDPTSHLDLSGLSDAERLLIAGELLEMAHCHYAPLTPAQVAEHEQYAADAEAGLVRGESWEIVRERLKRRG